VDREASAAECVEAARALADAGCDAVVVSLAHALANSRESILARELRARGVDAIAASEIAPHPRLLTRTETACVHAQIAPTLAAFVADATAQAPAARAFAFTSAGVLQRADRLLARDTLYSGPAGGARAVCAVAQRHGIGHAVGFDMGGTSSDVSRTVDGEVALRGESRINGMTVAAPSVAIDSVAAGGGSICRLHDGVLEVGPESAGANPGPACYGRGGPLTITDVNLLAGRMALGRGAMSLHAAPAEHTLDALAHARGIARDALLQAFLDIADARMALAIEALCVRDGVDPRNHALIAFGGAGGQHACAIATRLGVGRIVFPRFAGFMCAQGVFAAEPARFATRTILEPLDACAARLPELAADAVAQAVAALALDGFATPERTRVRASLRLAGQESSISVPFGASDELRARFTERFHELFGYAPPARAIEVVAIEATAFAARATEGAAPELVPPSGAADSNATQSMLSEGERSPARRLLRRELAPGEVIVGPAIVTDAGETVVVDRGWRAVVDPSGDLLASRHAPAAPRTSGAEQELFAARLEAIALAMGNVLERTALSPNIRDRLDFSCAVLDGHGTLVQNAPHLPVHLGALGVCTRAVMAELALEDGDIAVTNHPAFGGSHLPDVTTIAPVYAGGVRVAFVSVRAHHAEIGGTRPGSFPPDARSLAEEGVVLEPFLAVRRGAFDRAACRARFAGGAHPSRNPDENLADLEAQIAATRYGVSQVAALARELATSFAARCENELAGADAAARKALARVEHGGSAHATVHLDDGTPVEASITRAAASTAFAASGSDRWTLAIRSPIVRHARNFNAPFAVTRAAVLYALRLLIDRPVPMNEGLLRSIDLDVPRCMLNPSFTRDPLACPPVVAGNVETSQSIVAALIAALGLAAESQSTMNNVLFGNGRFTIYETLGGGAGAGPASAGASAVHVHMSNTRLTDIDVLERRAPVVIRRFEIRAGSGGAGRFAGGDGLVRTYEFRENVSLSFFGSRRRAAPMGMLGASDGTLGAQHLVAGGRVVDLADAVLSLELAAGDRFTVETPGGGGWGA
jgi:5-oxoprolinase (ATP-hydrolysing)